MLAKLIRLQCTFLGVCVCAHQCMYVHAFVLIIRLRWPLRWHHSLWIINTEQIKILFKSLPRKLALREREACTLDHYCLSFPQPCFQFCPTSECRLHDVCYHAVSALLSSAATAPPPDCMNFRKQCLLSTWDKFWLLLSKQKNSSFLSWLPELLLDMSSPLGAESLGSYCAFLYVCAWLEWSMATPPRSLTPLTH